MAVSKDSWVSIDQMIVQHIIYCIWQLLKLIMIELIVVVWTQSQANKIATHGKGSNLQESFNFWMKLSILTAKLPQNVNHLARLKYV